MPPESGNFEQQEVVTLTPEEEAVVEKGIALLKKTAEHGNADISAVKNVEDLAAMYGEEWNKLNNEYLDAFNALNPESQGKVTSKEMEEAERLGLKPKAA